MKTLKIEIPQGYEIDKEKSTFENIVFKLTKKELPKSWEELNLPINAFATSEQVLAVDAMRQLSQLLAVYNDGWMPDWSDCSQKYIIRFQDNNIDTNSFMSTQYFLSLKTTELRDKFLTNFRSLILTAKPLL
jgi:hypothetical protein